MMQATKNMDIALGVDIHLIQPPGPVPPVPIPHPFVGILFDVFDHLPIVGGTVFINNSPRALAGTEAKALPTHIPIGGAFVKPPGNEGSQFMGSTMVKMDGEVAAYNTLPVLSCQDVGAPAPPRPNPKQKSKPKSLMLPLSINITIPIGPPVMIGGAPTVSLFQIGFSIGLSALGKGLKKLANSKMMQNAMKKFKAMRQKAFKNMKPGFLKCKVLRAEPVNIVTGEVVVEQADFSLPWRIPLNWTRRYSSQSTRIGVCGYGWETPADARLEVDDMGIVTFFDGNPGASVFEGLPEGLPDEKPIMEMVDGALLEKTETGYMVTTKPGLMYHFPEFKRGQNEVVVGRVTDRCNNEVQYIRNERGALEEIQESSGIKILIRGQLDRIQEMILIHPIEDQPRLLLRYEYEGNHQLVRVYDALGNPYQFAYTGGVMTSHTDRNGLTFNYEYDELSPEGKCVHAWGDGGLYDYEFEYLEGETRFVDSLGGEWRSSHVNALIFKEIDPLGGVTNYEYDSSGRTSLVIDPNLNQTIYIYDFYGNVVKYVMPDNSEVHLDYNADGNLVKTIDPNSNEWTYVWDERGLFVERISPRGGIWSYSYNREGDLVSVKDPKGNQVHASYDSYGQCVEEKSDLGYITNYEYNALGLLTKFINQRKEEYGFLYDIKGQLLRIIDPISNVELFGYDPEGNLILYVDQEGNETRQEFSGLGEVMKRVNPDGTKVLYKLDTEENIISVTNEKGQEYNYLRDGLGNIIKEVDYWGGEKFFKRDPCGNIIKFVNSSGNKVRFEYDGLGRVLLRKFNTGEEERFAFDNNGNLILAENNTIIVERKYDSENNLINEKQGDFWLMKEYDISNNCIKIESSLGNKVEYNYDKRSEVISVVVNGDDFIAFERGERGLINNAKIFDYLNKNCSYDGTGRLSNVRIENDEKIISDKLISYDKLGNLVEYKDFVREINDKFFYDNNSRIIKFQKSSDQELSLHYDPTGNLGEQAEQNGNTDDYIRSLIFEDHTYQFNLDGNLVNLKSSRGSFEFGWDAINQLSSIQKNEQKNILFKYDALGRRVYKEVDGVVTRFHWNENVLLSEGNKDNSSVEYIYLPGSFEPIGLLGDKLYYYENDQIGLPRELIDRSGEIVWSGEYDVFGSFKENEDNICSNPIRFVGQYHDLETDLYYSRFRYYDPHLGRFISQDPIGLYWGADPYAYAPNVWSWTDPFGLACVKTAKPGEYYEAVIGRNGELILGRKLTKEQAVSVMRRHINEGAHGAGIYTKKAKDARKVATEAGKRPAVKHSAHPDRATGSKKGRYSHFHDRDHAGGGHSWYGAPH